MRLLIIRHADPDYEKDSLTEKGWREAELLSEKLKNEKIDYFYVSPLGRARDTASLTLNKTNQTAKTCKWLREFHSPVKDPESGKRRIPWDLYPDYLLQNKDLFDSEKWNKTSLMKSGKVGKEYERVSTELDILLRVHGYKRSGLFYSVEKSNSDTLALFCHFGVECVLLAHLLNIPPVCLWQGLCAAPSSVTTLYTEERKDGTAAFRCASFGDTSHLYVGNEPPAFAGRFCETFDIAEQRH